MKTSSIMKKFVTLLLAGILCFSAFACKGNDSSSSDSSSSGNDSSSVAPSNPVTIAIDASSDVIKMGEEITLTVTVENASDASYTWSVDEAGLALVQIADNVLSIKDDADVKIDTYVVVTATSNEDSRASASKTIKVIAPVVEGRVGDLTSEMIAEIGNSSITVTGTLTDVYFSNYYPQLNGETVYDMTVEMEEGKWRGIWNAQGSTATIEDNYRKGADDGVKDYNGNVGHALEKLHIDKNNKVAVTTVKDYMSIPAIWESQHLWNHLGNLNVNKFVYDIDNDFYVYTVDQKDMDGLYLMTYLSYCLTPMLSDTLVEIAFTVENGAITKLTGRTERVYEGLDEQTGEFDAYSDTIINLTFSNVGSTTVGAPTPFSAPENAAILEEVINEMSTLKNYTYKTVDRTISAPSGSGDDYELSVGSGDVTTFGVPTANTSTGQVGTIGYVTEDKILLHETGKYSYGMDDKLYYHSYSGYVQNNDNTYDYFQSKGGTLVGKRKYTGSMFDAMPNFDFSANVFKFAGMEQTVIGNVTLPLYKFVLRESAISRDVAMEINLDGKDSKASVVSDLVIWIANMNGDNVLYKTQIPYDLVSGTYLGVYETQYMAFGTTTINEEYFDGYVPRVIAQTWAETNTMYYQLNFEGNSFEENTQTVIDASYGDAGKDIPSPKMLFDIFGDCMNGPFYDWKETSEQDANGNPIKMGWISINLSLDDSLVDENTRIKDFDAVIARIREVFLANGYTESRANTDLTGGASGHASKWITFTKGDIIVAIENNNTRFFFIDFYPIGTWSLNR